VTLAATSRPGRHPIAVVAQRTGLSQDVLRVWERRYAAVQPTRGPGGQRLYSDADVERLALLHAATRAGRGIGQVARLDTDALAALVAEDEAARERRQATEGAPGTRAAGWDGARASNAAEVIDAALALAQALDAPALDDLLRRAATRLGITLFLDAVAVPLLRRIGEEWHAGRLTPAQEHLASAVLHEIVLETMRSLAPREGSARLLVATLAGERHAIGAALVGATAAVAGWNVTYLGADLPASEIATAAKARGVRAVAVSIVYVDDRTRVLREVEALRAQLPPGMTLLIGGAGAGALTSELTAAGARVETTLDRWLADLPSRPDAA
jgi:DNA-binding transcriptional MerR regulator/methylmalonyl-CoA mutase cobalamin-binding subunit